MQQHYTALINHRAMEKNYLRYAPQWFAGVITSPRAPVAVLPDTKEVVCGAGRDVVCWRVRTGERTRTLRRGDETDLVGASPLDGPRGEVVAVAAAVDGSIAAACASGLVRVWRGDADSPQAHDHHRAAVQALRWCPFAASLVTGGANGDIVLIDVVAERASHRLVGHRAAVTDLACLGDWAAGSDGRRLVASTSRDGLIKIWDARMQHCIQTITGAGGGVAVGIDHDMESNRVVTGAGDRELRLWRLDVDAEAPLDGLGSIKRHAMEPCQQLRFVAPRILGALTHGRTLELFRVRGAADAAKKAKRRARRRREKGLADENDEVAAADELEPLSVITSEHRLRSFCVVAVTSSTVSLVLSTRTNELELRDASITSQMARKGSVADAVEEAAVRTLQLPGHRSAVRAVAVSDDGAAVASAASKCVKIWSDDARLLRTLDAAKAVLAVAFLPGGRKLVAGLKSGVLLEVDAASGDTKEARDSDGSVAHAGAVLALAVSATAMDKTCVVSCGGDPLVKLWTHGDDGLTHAKTLPIEGEECLAVAFARDARGRKDGFVCVATTDHCVRVLYADTFKFKVSLYGHSLPCLCVGGSSDGKLLATGSSDKTLKLWGLEFGDLRRSILAHDDAVTGLAWLRGTHYCITTSKDGSVKQWDCDRLETPFVQLFRRGHTSEVWSVASNPDGSALYTAGADRALRCWARTDEPVFASEEQDAQLDATLDKLGDGLDEVAQPGASGHIIPAKTSHAAQKGAERIAEALELAQGEAAVRAAALEKGTQPPAPSPLLLGMAPRRYVLRRLGDLTSAADLEPALLVLPVDLVAVLLEFLADALDGDESVDVELCARAAALSLKLHAKEVSAHAPLRRPLLKLRDALRQRLDAERALFGRNLAACRIAKLRS